MFVGFRCHFAVYLYPRLPMFQSKAKPGQQSLWIVTEGIVSTPANLFYTRFDKALIAMGFLEQVRSLCRPIIRFAWSRPSRHRFACLL